MNKKVLILGNGISRLSYVDEIENYDGEVWACNYAFLDFPRKITRLTGHQEPLEEAQRLIEEEGLQLEIWGGPISGRNQNWKKFTVDPKWRRDSGSTMVAQALHEGYEVECCGFDMGGPHIYDHKYYQRDKSIWVKRWAEIAEEWGLDHVTFWGHDHKPFILDVLSGGVNYKKYAKTYRKRKPHLDDEGYKKIWGELIPMKNDKENKFLKVKFVSTGFETVMRESLAKKYLDKGKVELVKEKPEKPKADGKKSESEKSKPEDSKNEKTGDKK